MNTQKTYINPVCEGADPFVLLHDGKYYLYATNKSNAGYVVFESDDLINWKDMGFCLKKGDVKGDVVKISNFYYGFWAPEVLYHNEKFYMIYTVDNHIAVAISESPLGPFVQDEKKWLLEKTAIDGHFFKDDDGSVYLYYRSTEINRIAGVKMNPDMMSVDESTDTVLITPGEFPWEETIKGEIGTEGPFVLKHKGKYYLTYSANGYTDINYAVGYAISDSPLGKYKKYEGNPILKRSDTVYGTGHHSFTTSKDGKTLVCVYHCHNSIEKVHPRMICIDVAEFVPSEDSTDDILVIYGPTSTEMPVIN